MSKRKRPPKTAPRGKRARATTVERATRALEDLGEKKPPQKTDDPARDRTAIEDGALAPLDHAD